VSRAESQTALGASVHENGPAIIGGGLAEIIRVEAGVPRWGVDFGEETLPPEAGLDLTHIDYAKGCYIGQEVISRLKSVGHVNKQLRGFVSVTEAPLEKGWQLFSSDDPAKSLGHLTSATWSFALAKPIALGYLKRGAPSAKLFARSADSSAPGVEVALHDLPFVPHPFSA
jgi:aminomethyltransferase